MTDQSFLQYFTQIDSQEGIFLWMSMVIAFLFGFLIAYLLRSGKVRRLKKDNKQMSADLQTAETQLASAQEQLRERNLELQEESREKVDLMDRVARLEQERTQKLQEVVSLNQQLENLQLTNRQHEQTIHQLNTSSPESSNIDDNNTAPSPVVPQPTDMETVSVAEVSALQDRLSAFESTLRKLQNENEQLRVDLSDLKDHKESATPLVNTIPSPPAPSEPEEVHIETKKTVLYDKIIVPDRDQDNLTKIEGVGDFIAKKLNNNGIFTYAEIASWTPDRIKDVTELIGYIPGRIEKDNWVGQAALLLQQQVDSNTPAAQARSITAEEEKPKAKAPKGKKEGDLKIIEGIGPKIEEVLKNAGINDWASLAATEPGRLKEILEEAGDRFRMHNPYTWPLQARLAAAGRWDEFTKYQDELKGGKEQ